MKSSQFVRSTSRSLQARIMRQGLIGLAVLLPVATMGITVPTAYGLRVARQAADDARERLMERNALRARLSDWGDTRSVETLRLLDRSLATLIPTSIDPLVEYGAVRRAAADLGIELADVRHARTHTVPGALGVVVDEVALQLDATTDEALDLVQTIREGGFAVTVLGFDLGREDVARLTFRTELRLGFLRRVPAGAVAATPR